MKKYPNKWLGLQLSVDGSSCRPLPATNSDMATGG